MSRFNPNAVAAAISEYEEVYGAGNAKPTQAVRRSVNEAGGEAFNLSKELALYSLVCTMGLTDKYYQSESEQMKRLVELVKRNDPLFVAKLAVYARDKMYLRTIPLVLCIELAKIHRGDNLISTVLQRVIQRADEITEALAYYQVANGRAGETKKLAKLSNQVKQGIRKVFESGRFDEYQFAKYNRDAEVKLRDALFLTHPKPQDKAQKDIFDKIVNQSLDTPYTWETQLSEAGTTGRSKREVWEELIASGRLGYMAMLRNLRNFFKEEVSREHMTLVMNTIANRDNVLKSKQLPFRFLSAYRSLVDTPKRWIYEANNAPEYVSTSPYLSGILEALNTAVRYSVENLPMFNGENVLISTDVSGSMMQPISPKSSVLQFDIGALMCMIAKSACENSVASMFGDTFKTLTVGKMDILNNVQEIYRREGEVGYSTNGWKVIDSALKSGNKYDRIMIFSDMQLYGHSGYGGNIDTLWGTYKSRYPNAKLYLFDLNGYGRVPIRMENNDVFLIAGWSDKIFDIVKRIEMGQTAIDEIESVEI